MYISVCVYLCFYLHIYMTFRRKTPQSSIDIRAQSFSSPIDNDNSILDPVDEDLFSPPKMAILAPKVATEVR
jgi:hypothetical protein